MSIAIIGARRHARRELPNDIFGGGQSSAASDAAKYTAEATKYATDKGWEQFQQMQQNLAPYMGAGQTGLMALMGMLGLPTGGAATGGFGGATGAGGLTADKLREQLLPQFTTGAGASGNPPSLWDLGYGMTETLANRASKNATWGYNPAKKEWGYTVHGGTSGDSSPTSQWVGAGGWTPGGGSTVDEAGLQKAIQAAMASQNQQNQQAAGAFSGLGKLLQTPFSFDASDLENTPGYQFTMQQGLKSLANQNAAKGLGLSGAQQKGSLEYATGLADNTFGQQYNRALQSYMTNYGMASDMFNRLSGLSSMGQNAAAGVGNAGMQTASSMGNIAMQGAQAQGQAGLAAAQANQSILPNIMNAGLAGVGIYSLLSDRRFKTNISEIGRTPGGHKWYRYQYIGRPGWHQGVMAQEVEITQPEAITEVDGVKYVDYSKVH